MDTTLTVLPEDTFTFGTQPVRTVIREGGLPWFVAADVCDLLGYRRPGDALRHVDPEDYIVVSTDDVLAGQPEDALFATPRMGNLRQNVSLVNESGLYSLILRSNRPEARAFKRWVTCEVLPEIRRTGGYGLAVPTALPDALELAAAQARRLDAARAELAAAQTEVTVAHAQLAAAEPKVEAFDTYLDADGSVSMGAVANMLGIGRTTLFELLRQAGILQRKDNRPYQRHAHHFHVIGETRPHPSGSDRASYTVRVRPSGVELIRRVLTETPTPRIAAPQQARRLW